MDSNLPDVVIVGGGLAGCSSAYFLSGKGLKVLLLEKDGVASGASSGAAGMLGVDSEPTADPARRAFARESRALYESLAPELRAATGVDIEFEGHGLLTAARNEEESTLLRGRASGGHGDYWNVESIARYCPELIPFPFGGLFHPTDGQVTASRAAEAFRRGAVASGAVVREGQRVTGLLRRGRRVVGVRVGRDRIVAGMTLLCLGARGWALTDSLGWRPPIFPVRGEIMIFRPVRRLLPVPVFLGESGVYMVPKPDGTFLVGATSTRTGRAVFTAAGQKRLSASALAALPALADAPYLGGWAGLRPGTPDGWPLLGPVPEWDGVWIAAGHFRRGVLLAPATGLWMAEAMTGAPRASMARFSPARFSKEPVVL